MTEGRALTPENLQETLTDIDTFKKLLNKDGFHETSGGKTLPSYCELVKSFGFTIIGDFGDVLTINTANQLLKDASGSTWRYNGALPFEATSTTTPLAPDWVETPIILTIETIKQALIESRFKTNELNQSIYLNNKPQYVAHRGLSSIAPENTLPAYEAAARGGFDIAECDLQLTSDGHWVVIHDSSVNRTTDGSGSVNDMTLAEIKELDAGSWFSDYYANTKIPTLSEFLKVCNRLELIPLIEIKIGTYSDGDIQKVINQCKEAFPSLQFILCSFQIEVLAQIRALDFDISLQYLDVVWRTLAIDLCVDIGKCDYFVKYDQIPNDLSYAFDRGININSFTVNQADVAASLLERGVRQITTDFVNLR